MSPKSLASNIGRSCDQPKPQKSPEECEDINIQDDLYGHAFGYFGDDENIEGVIKHETLDN